MLGGGGGANGDGGVDGGAGGDGGVDGGGRDGMAQPSEEFATPSQCAIEFNAAFQSDGTWATNIAWMGSLLQLLKSPVFPPICGLNIP